MSGQAYTANDYTTNYSYDVLDNLKQVTPSQSALQRTFSYDGLSRLTQAVNPENGTVQYSSYDGNGNLLTKIANSITTSYQYDALNRLKQKSYSPNTTPQVTYTYDTDMRQPGDSAPNYPAGRLSEVSTPALGNILATDTIYTHYDAMGRVTGSRQDTAGSPYLFSYSYSDLSLDTETFPSGRKVESCYDAAGRVSNLLNVTQTPAVSYGALSYTLAGGASTTTKTLGNGLVETDTANTLHQVASIQLGTSGAPGSVLALAYGYAAAGSNNGNVLSQTITRGAASGGQTFVQTYQYADGLNRLTSASEAASSGNTGWYRTFGADPWGNGWVLTNSVVTLNAFTPMGPTNFVNNQLIIQNSTYDGAGNQTAIGGFGMTYDAENRMTSSTISGATTQYGYDGDGRRVTKTQGSQTTIYVYDAMGQRVAEYGVASTDTGTKYVTADALGSTRLVTDAGGNAERCYDYLPFGEEIASGTNGRTAGCYSSGVVALTEKFTGKERDAESGIDFFEARYMSSAQGRFASPDPVAGSVANPQSFNMYAYVCNNPLRLTDPTGMIVSWEDSDKKCKKGETECRTDDQRQYEDDIKRLQNSKNKKDRARGDALAATYQQLRDSTDITFHVVTSNPEGESSGELEYHGVPGDLYVDLKGNANAYGALTPMQKIGHEFEHGSQFLHGLLGFTNITGTWQGYRDDLVDEANAFIAGFQAEPVGPSQSSFLKDIQSASNGGVGAVVNVLDREGPYQGRSTQQQAITTITPNIYAVPSH